MNEEAYQSANQFSLPGSITDIREIVTGHINRTYEILTTGASFILQRINTDIFRDVDGLMNNIDFVTSHIRKKITARGGDPDRETLTIIPTKDGKLYFRDGNHCYRMFKTITNARTYDSLTSNCMFEKVGKAVGRFQEQLSDFDASLLSETIPDFHNTVKRYTAFYQAIQEDRAKRVDHVQKEIRFLLDRAIKASYMMDGMAEGRFPLRVTHNDTKLNNIMIDDRTGDGICVIDLDTVMPGSVLADFGDAIRFGASSTAEDETDLEKVHLKLDAFDAFTKGFIEGLNHSLTAEEINALPMGAYLMTLEVGLRFLTDYLGGDTYFRIAYPEHNLDRARNQLKLVADMEEKMSEMQKIVKNYLPV